MMKLCLPCNLVPNCTTVSCRPSMNDSCMCHISTAPDHSFGHRHIHQLMIPAAKTSQPTCAIALGSSCADTECSPPHRPPPPCSHTLSPGTIPRSSLPSRYTSPLCRCTTAPHQPGSPSLQHLSHTRECHSHDKQHAWCSAKHRVTKQDWSLSCSPDDKSRLGQGGRGVKGGIEEVHRGRGMACLGYMWSQTMWV